MDEIDKSPERNMSRMLDELAEGVHNRSFGKRDVSVDNLDPATEFYEYTRQLKEACNSGSIPRLTSQEIALLTYVRMGLPITHAIKASGMAKSRALAFIEADPRAREATEYAAILHTSTINVTAELLTMQAYEERARAATATEGLKALEVVAKLNRIGAYDTGSSQQKGRLIDGQVMALENGSKKAKNRKQLEQMSDDALLEGAALDYDGLEPEPVDYNQTAERDYEHPFDDKNSGDIDDAITTDID